MIQEGQVWHARPSMINGKKYVGPKARVDKVRTNPNPSLTQGWLDSEVSVYYSHIGPGTCKGDGGACRLDTFQSMYYLKDQQLRLGA